MYDFDTINSMVGLQGVYKRDVVSEVLVAITEIISTV
jgi:hypothetical protein